MADLFPNNDRQVLVRVENLVKHFPITRGVIQRVVGQVKAVDGISFEIYQGETFSLVGESGCGKTTAGRTILQLYRPTSGHVFFGDQDLTALKGEALRRMRRKMQMIFQDPYSSLDPRMSIGNIVGEPLEQHNVAHGKAKERVRQRSAGEGGPAPIFCRPLPARMLGRAAPAGGDRPRPGPAPGADRVR